VIVQKTLVHVMDNYFVWLHDMEAQTFGGHCVDMARIGRYVGDAFRHFCREVDECRLRATLALCLHRELLIQFDLGEALRILG